MKNLILSTFTGLFTLVSSIGITSSLACMPKENPFERLPSELRHSIAALSLESTLNYNFNVSKILFTAPTGINSVAFSPDGTTVLIGCSDNTARLLDVKTGQQLKELLGHNGMVTSVAFSPDGATALTGSLDTTARLWDVKTGQQLQVFTGHTDWVNSVAYSPNSAIVLTGSRDRTARLWDVKTGQQLHILEGHKYDINSVAYSPEGTTVLTGSDDTTARLWDVKTGQELQVFTVRENLVNSVAYSPDGATIITGSQYGIARLWDIKTGTQLQVFTGHKTGRRQHEIFPKGHSAGINSIAFNPDGNTVLTGSDDKTARLWDVKTGQQLQILKGHTHSVSSVAFSPDGDTIITGSSDKTVRLWSRSKERSNVLQERIGSAEELYTNKLGQLLARPRQV
ncbi:WD40 repeat domain-containing protein [Candidatus Dependentiae bacterium]|nr:WD40 repeat domain-containing protein [Candidatus Dependentiae bacterium]